MTLQNSKFYWWKEFSPNYAVKVTTAGGEIGKKISPS
jgi:hypothetical protein